MDLTFAPLELFQRVRTASIAPEAKAQAFSDLCRLNVLYMVKRAGSGHLGTSFSCMDVVAWLHLFEMRPEQDLYFSSKGHDAPALYSILLGLERLPFPLVHELRRLGGLPGHPDVKTPFANANTGSLGMGISKAKGMVHAKRLQGTKGRVFVLTGDGELQEGQIWESLTGAASRKMAELTVIVDRNQIQSDTWVEATSSLQDLGAKFRAFGWNVVEADGHGFRSIADALAAVKKTTDRPTVILANTRKGAGVSFMEGIPTGERLYRFHSGAPSDENYQRAVKEITDRLSAGFTRHGMGSVDLERAPAPPHRKIAPGAQDLVGAYGKALVDQAGRDRTIVALDADLVLDTGLIPFQERFPERFIECGIAEQDMVSQAGGMALRGLLPVAHSFACFLSTRPNEQIYNNATEGTRVIYAGSLAGLVPAGPGHSHQCVRDISALGAVPDLALVEPAWEDQVRQVVEYAVHTNKQSTYIRLVSVKTELPFKPPEAGLEEGKGIKVGEGPDATIITYGPIMLREAFLAREELAREGIHVGLVNLPWLNRVDLDWLSRLADATPDLITIDNHYTKGGQGDFLAARLAGTGRRWRLLQLGVESVPKCGKNEEVLAAHGLDAASIAGRVRAFLAVPATPRARA